MKARRQRAMAASAHCIQPRKSRAIVGLRGIPSVVFLGTDRLTAIQRLGDTFLRFTSGERRNIDRNLERWEQPVSRYFCLGQFMLDSRTSSFDVK